MAAAPKLDGTPASIAKFLAWHNAHPWPAGRAGGRVTISAAASTATTTELASSRGTENGAGLAETTEFRKG